MTNHNQTIHFLPSATLRSNSCNNALSLIIKLLNMSCNIWKYVRSDLYLTVFRDADYGTCKMSISYRSLHLPRLFFDVLDWMTKKQKHCLVKSFFGYSLVDFGQKALALVKLNSFLYEFFCTLCDTYLLFSMKITILPLSYIQWYPKHNPYFRTTLVIRSICFSTKPMISI